MRMHAHVGVLSLGQHWGTISQDQGELWRAPRKHLSPSAPVASAKPPARASDGRQTLLRARAMDVRPAREVCDV